MTGNISSRVLVTGGAGFIGAHLSRALRARGQEVIALDDLSTGRMSNIEDLLDDPGFRFVEGSVCDEALVDELMAGCSVVYHMAAAVGVELVVQDPLGTIRTNINGTEVVLEVALRHGTKAMIASTSEVYGKCATLPASEDDDVLMGATRHSRWSYAASKMVDEFLALAYHRQAGLPVVVFRLFNTVGPRQSGRYGMVIPRFCAAALEGRALPVHGDGQQSRSFLHVHDAIAGILALTDSPEAIGQVFNVGASHEVSIRTLAETVLRLAGRPCDETGIDYISYDAAYGAGYEDIRRRVADTSKLNALTGWTPTRSLENILVDVLEDLRAQSPVGV